MNSRNLAIQPPPSADRIYVSWTEHWDLPRYVDNYLKERKLALNDELRGAVRRRIARFPAEGTLRKSDMDYYLDSNACEFIERRRPNAA